MNLYIRLILLLIKRAFVCKRIDIFDSCETNFRVAPSDLDINFHMNNGKYLSLMDLGRVDLMIKAGIFGTLVKKGFYPVVVSQSIRFKKSLEPLQKFKMITTIESWDEKDFFISQKFVVGEIIYAEGYIKGRFKQRGRKGSITTPELFAASGIEYKEASISKKADAQNEIEKFLAKT